MLHTETVETGTLVLIKRLSKEAALENFVLAGGTALSLQLGHRKSIDLDFFSSTPFDSHEISRQLAKNQKASGISTSRHMLFMDIGDVKASFLLHPYPLVGPVNQSEGTRLASLDDIGAMKLNAIVRNGTRLKDYVDIHFILENKTLDQLLKAYSEKYYDSNPAIAKNALLYHKEIDRSAEIELTGGNLKWSEVLKRLKESVAQPGRSFAQIKTEGLVDRNQLPQPPKQKTGRRR